MVFEVLVEDPRGTVTAPGFATVDPVTLERRNFRRFVGQDVKDGVGVVIDLPVARGNWRNVYIAGLLVAIGGLMLLVLSSAMQRRTRNAAANATSARDGRATVVPLHERLAQQIAALDAQHAHETDASDERQQAYEAQRAALKAALSDALADVTSTR